MRKIVLSVIGLLVALVAATFVAQQIGERRFGGKVRRELRVIADTAQARTGTVSAEDLEALPEPVRRYFRYAGVEGKRPVWSARARHRGTFLVGQRRMPVEGEYYFTADPPSFIWYANLNAAPGVRVKVRDKYHGGKGNVLAKALSLITVADGKGREVDEASLLRCLTEIVLVPTALLPGEHLRWDGIDTDFARATIRDNGVEASAIFYFDEEGRIARVVGNRYRMEVNGYSKWTGYYKRYKEVDGMKVPTEFEAVWNLSSGGLPYARFNITDIRYNDPPTPGPKE